mgnify:CR=1 FL=1
MLGNYTCGSSFKPGSYRRSNENLNGQRFLVVESDSLSKDEVGAVFAYLHRRLRYRLHCIIDTAGKSLHGWFDAPRNKMLETRLKAGLEAFAGHGVLYSFADRAFNPEKAFTDLDLRDMGLTRDEYAAINAQIVKQKSRDFFWYSPRLKRQLDAVTGDIVVSPGNEVELRALLSRGPVRGILGSLARRAARAAPR